MNSLEDLDLDQFLKEMGLSNNNNFEAPYKTDNELTFSDTEDKLLSNYSKTKIEDLFIVINDFTKLYNEFEDLFKMESGQIDIKLMNESWSLEKIVLYFKQFTTICIDHFNTVCNFVNYIKDNNFDKMKERVLNAYKVFNPICKSNIEVNTLIDILQVLRNIQSEYLNGACFYAYTKNLSIDTIEDRTKILLQYNNEVKSLSKDSFFNLKNELSQADLKKRVEAIANNIINDNSIKSFVDIKLSQEDMKLQIKDLIDKYNELEDKCEVLNNFIDSDHSFSYNKAKLAYKKTNFGSTNDYLNDLKHSVNDLYSISKSIFELIILDSQKHRNDIKEILEENEFGLEYDSLEDIYQSLIKCIQLIVSPFIVFCEQKKLNWTSEIDIKKANNKFLKKVEKHGINRRIEKPIYYKNKILEDLQGENI